MKKTKKSRTNSRNRRTRRLNNKGSAINSSTDATQGPVNVTFTNNSTKRGSNIKISNK